MNDRIEKILETIPNDHHEKLHYIARIKKYSGECGCSTGAWFMLISIVGTAIYLYHADLEDANLFRVILSSLLVVFIASGAGKLIGIAMAKIRLKMLCKSIINKYGQ